MNLEQIEKFLNGFASQIITNPKVKSALETEAVKSVMRNFEQGGRPDKWIPTGTKTKSDRSVPAKRKAGKKTLIESGEMSQIQSEVESTAEGLRLTLMPGPNSRAYARIQHEGGVINMPARTLRFRRSKTGRTVFAKNKHKRITKQSLAKPYSITIPARPYLLIPEEDFPNIMDAIASAMRL